jgi:type I restriction enzyme, S subunit
MKVQMKKLSDVAIINPRRPHIERSDDELTSFVPMENVNNVLGTIPFLNSDPYLKLKKGYTYFENGDVIFAKITPCMQNGKHAILSNMIDGFGFGSTEFHVIRATEKIIPDWIHFYLRRKETLDSAVKTFTGTVGQQRVPTSFLENLEIPVPPIEKQRQITTRLKAQLAEVENARQAAEMQLRDAKALNAAILKEVFENRQSSSWPITKLGDVGEVVAGITLGRKTNGKKTKPVSYLRVANVKDGHLDLSDVKTIDATESEIERLRLQQGDILLTEGGDPDKLGRGTFWQSEIEECLHQNHIFRVRFQKDKYLPDFIAAQIGSTYGKDYFFAHAKKTTGIATINQQVLKAFPLLSPDIGIQKKVMIELSGRLQETQAIISAAETQISDINLLPQKILSQAFGDIRP